ncbi:14-3-3 domain containing [Cryptosporidium sp. chipmunk genotype I]|uniref:14-3-3 domain containing n=1 Tax=Cryptosporidium sp. chipmunk genotype I TaxID=1280935 RepID=UPI00351AA94B|nr:14-3-3 domain containing [Cryptosporidium sp. chipmunk genotype I]
MSKRHTQRIEVVANLDKNKKNVDLNSNLSARRLLTGNSASRRVLGSGKRNSVPRLNSLSLEEFDLENEEFDCWEYYSKIEKGLIDVNNEIEDIIIDNSKLESYVKLFNVFYSSLTSGNGSYLNEMSDYWESLLKNLEEASEMNKSVFERLIKSFIGRLFINISSFNDAKCYYSAMIYLIISILPNRPQVITTIRPFIIRKIIRMINESQIKKQFSQNKQTKKSKASTSRKKKSRNSDKSNSDSEEKENDFSGIEKIRFNSKSSNGYDNKDGPSTLDNSRENSYFEQDQGNIGPDASLILQLKLLSCIIVFCKYLDISNNLAQTGLEGLNELIEGMSDLLVYNDNFPKTSQFINEISNLTVIISRMNDYLINNSPEITSFLQEKGDYNISRIITIGIVLLFINIGGNRYIKVLSINGDIIQRFRTIRIENRHFEIVIYSSIILLRKMIPLTLLGSENSLTNNIASSSNIGSKTQTQTQTLLIQKIFNLIKEITTLFPELSHPNILFIINKIIEIQYGVFSNKEKNLKKESFHNRKSKKKSKHLKKGDEEEDDDYDGEFQDQDQEELSIEEEKLFIEEAEEIENFKSDGEIEQIGGVKLLEELKKRISDLRDSEFYYIDNVIFRCFLDNYNCSENDIFLNDPILGYIFSVYLLLSEKSEARQNVLEQIHISLIPTLVEVTETKNSTKMLLFDILKQTLFNSEKNPVGGIKEVNSFISFLSNYKIEYNINTIKEIDHEITQKMSAFPFKFPQLLYRRIISILPIMFHSSKPNYRIIAIDIAGYILQLRSSIELLSVFIQNISSKLPLNELNSKNKSKMNVIDRQIIVFSRMLSIIFEIFQDNINLIVPSEQLQSPGNTRSNGDLDLRSEVIINNSSRRNSSARQSIEWSGITMDNKQENFTAVLNFAQGEMAIQLYNLLILLLERSKDISPNIRIKSVTMISAIVFSACDIYQLLNEEMAKVIIGGLSILLGDFGVNHTGNHYCYHSKYNNALIPFVQLILGCISDEKAICRKGSLILWDSLFLYLKLKKAQIPTLKKYILTLFKNTLTDSSILVRRHSIQSLHTLYSHSPQLKWVSNLWINYGLPTIMDTENFMVDKITELCYNMLLEQIKKLTEYINEYNATKININDYIREIKQEYLFSWVSLKSQKENQIQIINLHRICIRNILRKYPLVLQPLIQFLNIFIEFFTQFLQFNSLERQENNQDNNSNNNNNNSNQSDKFEFPDLPFVIIEEIYIYINQNNVNQTQKDNIFVMTQRIYDIMTEYIVGEEKETNPIIIMVISENNLLTILNSLFEIFKLFLTTYFNSRKNTNILTSPDKVKLISLYEKIIFMKPLFYSRLTKTLIIYQYPAQLLSLSGNKCNLLKKIIYSSSLSTIIYILYLWDELNAEKDDSKKKNKQASLMNFVNSLFNLGGISHEEVNSEFKDCIIPNIKSEIKCIEAIYLSSLILLSSQLKGGNHEMLNIRILGELFLLNYTITNMNMNNSKKVDEVSLLDSIDSKNIEKLVPYLEELYKKFKTKHFERKRNGESILNLESNLSILILALGKASYSTSNIAKKVIMQYMVTELQDSNAPLSIRNNILIILHDLYILHTPLVDPHLISMFSIIVKERKRVNEESKDLNLILRKQSLLLLSDLIGQGYIKLRGSYLLRLLHSLVDRDNNIRNIAHGIFERILLKTNTSILVQNFIEILCYLNNWIDHPSIKSWNLREKMVSTKHYSGSTEDFDENEKQYILKFIFNHLSDKQKHETITRIVHDFLALFIDQSSVVTLPESYEHNNGKTLKDALSLLYSSDLCIYHKYSKRSYIGGVNSSNNNSNNNNNNSRSSSKLQVENYLFESNQLDTTNITESAFGKETDTYYDGNKTGTANMLKELIQASLAIDIIPTLLSLKHLMKQSCSPFIKDIHKCIGELLKDYRNNLSSIIQDTTLIKELEYDFKMGYI